MSFSALVSRRKAESGFTMIELLVVVIIIAILAAVAIPVYIGIQNNAKKSSIQSDVATTKLNVAAVLAEDGTVTSATFAASDASKNAGQAAVQNSHSPADETVTVTVATSGIYTVTGTSASLGYTVSYDAGTGAQTGEGTAVAAGGSNATAYTLTAEVGDATNSFWGLNSGTNFTTDKAYAGTRSVRVNYGGYTRVNFTPALKVGTTYTVVAHAWADPSSTGIALVPFTSESTYNTTYPRTTTTGQWETLTTTFTPTTTGAMLNFGSYGGGSGYVDDVSVTPSN